MKTSKNTKYCLILLILLFVFVASNKSKATELLNFIRDNNNTNNSTQAKSYDFNKEKISNSNNLFLNQVIYQEEEEETKEEEEDSDDVFGFQTDTKLLPGAKDINKFFEKPHISLTYGSNNINYLVDNVEGFSNNFTNSNIFKLKLGDVKIKKTKSEDVLVYDASYFAVSNFTNEINKPTDNSQINFNAWRVSLFGNNEGYAYQIGQDSYLALTNGSELNWNFLRLGDVYSSNDSSAKVAMANFGQEVRFGNSFEAGIKMKFLGGLGLEANYERSVIYQRHLFFKWAGSAIIENIAQGIVDRFVKKIMPYSPSATPIINFLLKNALSYGIYELRQESMNWPFGSSQPLAIDNFKFGITYDF